MRPCVQTSVLFYFTGPFDSILAREPRPALGYTGGNGSLADRAPSARLPMVSRHHAALAGAAGSISSGSSPPAAPRAACAPRCARRSTPPRQPCSTERARPVRIEIRALAHWILRTYYPSGNTRVVVYGSLVVVLTNHAETNRASNACARIKTSTVFY